MFGLEIPIEIGGALILAVQTVLAALIANTRKNTHLIKEEVKNAHKTNLREEQDVRHEVTTKTLNRIEARLQLQDERELQSRTEMLKHGKKIDRVDSHLNKHIAWSSSYVQDSEERLRALENTADLNKEKS